MTNDCLVQEVDDVDVVVDAVQQEVVLAVRADAVGGEAAAWRIARALLGRQYAGRQPCKKGKRALSTKRQFATFFELTSGADDGAFGLQHRCRGGDFYRLIHFTNSKSQVDCRTIAGRESNPCWTVFLKPAASASIL